MWALLLLFQMSVFMPPGPVRVMDGREPARCDGSVLRGLYAGFDSADPETQAELAALAGLMDWSGGVQELRAAAGRFDRGALPALLALAVLEDVDSVELFREVVRQGSDGASVAVAAYVLGQWRDNFSYSTLLVGLMRPRCHGACVAGLLAGVVSLTHHPFLRTLLQLVHRASPSGEARVAAAAWLASAAGKSTSDELRATLTEVLSPTDLAQDEKLLAVRVLAMWGMARLSETDCDAALAAGMTAMDEAGTPEKRRRLARAILSAGLPCLRRGDGGDERAARLLREADWNQALVSDKTRFSSWLPPVFLDGDPESSLGVLDQAESGSPGIPAVCRKKLSSAEGYGLHSVPRRILRRPDLKDLARQSRDWSPMQGFDRYEFTPKQPTWWPDWIDITIDDGPQPTMFRLRAILDALDRWGVRATFFFIGGNMARLAVAHPEEGTALMRRVLLSGHRLGYHSVSHDTTYNWHLQFFTPEQIRDDVDLFEEIVSASVGLQWERRWARLPGGMGRSRPNVRQGLELAGLHDHVHWHIDQPNWEPGTSAAELQRLAYRLVEARRPTVILVHETATLGKQLDAFIEAVFEATCDGEARIAPGRPPVCEPRSIPTRAVAP